MARRSEQDYFAVTCAVPEFPTGIQADCSGAFHAARALPRHVRVKEGMGNPCHFSDLLYTDSMGFKAPGAYVLLVDDFSSSLRVA